MNSAIATDDDDVYQVVRTELSLEQVQLCLTRLESKQVDCVIGLTDALGAAPAIDLAADRWWLKVPLHHQSAATELLAALERPVRLLRHDVTWKYAFVASVLTIPINQYLLASTSFTPLTLAVTAVAVSLAAFYGHQRTTFVCSDPECQAVNEPTAEWCVRCGARIDS